MNLFLTKESVRKYLLKRRLGTPFEEIYSLSIDIQKRFIRTAEFLRARKLALYASFKNEALTDEIFSKARDAGKEIYFPRIIKKNFGLAFYKVKKKEDLSPGSHDVPEPTPERETEAKAETFDCVVIPGIAFDLRGVRVGYGKGYYDRVLSSVKCPKVALAFDFQVMDVDLPCNEHDVRVTKIVTEKRIITIKEERS